MNKRYPKYKPSGVEWIGEIPEHWEVLPLKIISKIILGKMLTLEEKKGFIKKPYLRAQNIKWLNPELDDIKEMWFSQEESEKLKIYKNDLLVSEGGEVGRTCIWNENIKNCCVQNSVHIVRIKNKYFARYFLYHFYATGSIGYFNAIVNKISIAHLTVEKLRDVRFLVPPLNEQKLITDFLDSKNSFIEESIQKKERLIELLKEERSAIINRAVTKGIDPNVRLKDSGVEWLGKIPEHWEVKKLKYILTIKNGDSIKQEDLLDSGGYTAYGGNGPIGNHISYNHDGVALVIGRVGAKCGNVHLVKGKKWVSDNALIGEVTELPDFMFLLLTSMNLNQYANQNAQPLITGTLIRDQIVALPPLVEQNQITEYIKSYNTIVSRAKSNAEAEVALLREYRTALINEVVTGKRSILN